MTDEVVPGWGSIVGVACGVLVALVSPLWAVVLLADDRTGRALGLLAFSALGVVQAFAAVRLRSGALGPFAVSLVFATAMAVTGVLVLADGAHRKTGLLLGGAATVLAVLVVLESLRLIRPSGGGRHSDG